jgi:hypothetical protein
MLYPMKFQGHGDKPLNLSINSRRLNYQAGPFEQEK